jgi:hypothetical protein
VPRRPYKSASSRPARGSYPGRNGHGLALIQIDGAPIRRKIQKEYEKAHRNLSKSRADLDRFHREDVPLYGQWLNRTFGGLLTDLRETNRRVTEAEQLVLEIEEEYYSRGGSYAAAYRRVLRRRENPEPEPAQTGRPNADQDPGDPGHDQDAAGPEGPNPFSDFFGEAFENFLHEFEEFFGESFESDPTTGRQKRGRSRGRQKEPPGAGRLKDLYRALVRRLHPDTQGEMSPKKLEWWHQVQSAYASRDVEGLEVILALCEIDDTGQTGSTSLSLLQRITLQFKKALREIKSQINRLRRDPAWNFSRRCDRHVLEGQIRWQMEHELDQLRRQLAQFESMLAHWKTAAERPAARRRTRRRPDPESLEFLFSSF